MKNSTLVFVALLLTACAKKQAAETKSQPGTTATHVKITEEQFKHLGIEVGKVTSLVISGTIKANGMLDVPPQNLVSISAPMGGFVKRTEFLQGMHIKKGQTVVELEHPDFIQLQADYSVMKNQFEYSELEYLRQKELAKENVSAARDLQMAKSNYETARAKMMGLKAKLDLINIKVNDLVKGEFKSTISILSPISGYVSQVNVNLGMFVSPSTLMFRIVDTDHLHAEVQVFEKDLPKLKVGEKVFLQLANESTEREAEVYLIGKEITAERTVRVHCHLKQEDPKLIPGLFFTARIETETSTTTALPAEAILLIENKNYVFAQRNPLLFELVEVERGVAENGFIQVSWPAHEKETNIVTKGAYFLLGILKNMQED